MGVDGKYRQMVKPLRLFVFALSLCALVSLDVAEAQIPREEPTDNVRRRAAEKLLARNPYWDGFRLKHQGDCAGAIELLRPLAKGGRGFEDAQVALGECLVQQAGIVNLADAASRMQGILVELYVVKQGPNADPIDGAKWAHLYLTNPNRLTIGAPVFIAHVIDNLQSQITTDEWLLGKERARVWTPRFDAP
jgi:hypothetical protein